MKNIDLSSKDRLLLVNQYLILERLYPDDAEEYAKLREALRSGYVREYPRLFESIFEEFSEEGCREVYDILDMHRDLNFSHEDAGVEAEKVRFRGFDGNNETEQMAHTRYLLKDLGLYEELQEKNHDYNNHSHSLPRYRAMLREWRTIREKKKHSEGHLTKKEIEQILSAR